MPVREDRVGPPRDRPWRPAVGIAPQLSDAELVTLAMMQAMLGFASEARWLRHARSHLRHLFPYLPKQPGYNKRLRMAGQRPGHGASARCVDCRSRDGAAAGAQIAASIMESPATLRANRSLSPTTWRGIE
jgi:hypothetical protein